MTDILNAAVLMLNFVVVPAAAYGAQLALGALGVTLTYAVLRFSNFAHADLMAFGAMATILATWELQALGVSLGPLPTALLALPVGVAAAGLFSLAADKLVFGYYRRRKAPPMTFLVASIGVMMILHGLVRMIIGVGDKRFADGSRFIISAREFRAETGLREGLAIKVTQGLTILVAAAAVAALFWFLQRTRTGKAMRAFADNEDLALLSGVDPERVARIAWLLIAALATLAGVLYGLDKGFQPFTYFQLILPIFAAAILGGIGNPVGAIIGAFVVAFSEVMVTYAYRKFLSYLGPEGWAPDGLVQILSTEYKFAVSFIILVLILILRPTGIMRGKTL